MSSLFSSADRARLIELVQRDAVLFGHFTLKSGKTSNVYFDCRLVTLAAESNELIARGMLAALDGIEFDAVGGPTMGADPIVGGMLAVAGALGKPLRGFLVRKEAKEHGTGKRIEGPFRAGDRVVLVEDVATTGGSVAEAAEAVRGAGGEVVMILTVVDRLQGAEANLAAKGLKLGSLLTSNDLRLTPPGG
jgi:orotate phosphoribosyltransferase